MAIATPALDATARRYTAPMTSIRGRRIHRLLMREFARFDHVLPVTAADGTPALLALADGGGAAVCSSDGRGAAADIVEWTRAGGAAVTLAYDLLRDSLPIVRWTIRPPAFDLLGGALVLEAADVPAAERGQVTAVLRGL